MAKRILIITYSFPPINVVSSARFGETAPQMKRFGWEPFILTTKSEGELPVQIEERNILRIGTHCDSGKKLVEEEGYRGLSLLLKPVYFVYKKLGIKLESLDRFVFSWRREVLKNIDKIKEINPDVIIATTPPIACLWLGRDIAKILGKPWVADFRDSCSLYNSCKTPFIKTIDRYLDKKITKTASLITTVGPYLAEKMSGFYKKEVKVIYNGFKAEKLQFLQERSENSPRIIYYAGRFHPHRLKAVRLLIDWLAKTDRNLKLVIRSLGPAEANKEILSIRTDKVELLEPSSAETILKEEKGADFLAIFEDLTEQKDISKGTMTGKLFEYLPHSATILAVTRPDSDIGAVLKETNRGEVVSSAKDLDNFFSKTKKDPNLQALKKYTREFQTERLCYFLDRL